MMNRRTPLANGAAGPVIREHPGYSVLPAAATYIQPPDCYASNLAPHP